MAYMASGWALLTVAGYSHYRGGHGYRLLLQKTNVLFREPVSGSTDQYLDLETVHVLCAISFIKATKFGRHFAPPG